MADKKTVLCVDDEADIIELLKEEFEEAGFNVLTAANGLQAFELYKKNKIDCLISDIRMPGGDGVELVRKMTEDGANLPIYLITGFSDYTAKELEGLGVKAVVFKPFDLGEIVEMVKGSLG